MLSKVGTYRVRSLHNQSFKKNTSYLLLKEFIIRFSEEEQQQIHEVVCVTVRIAQLVCDSVQNKIPPLSIVHSKELLEDVRGGICSQYPRWVGCKKCRGCLSSDVYDH